MSLKRQLLVSFALQGMGAAAVLLVTLLLGVRFGPEVQGAFSRTKAEIEFVSAFTMFGLPQALFFYVKSGALSGRSALRWALGCALLALPLATAYASWRHADESWFMAVLMGLAVAATVAHGMLRALLLVRERTAWFNIITALPQVLVLLGVLHLITHEIPDAHHWPTLFAIACATAAALSWARLRKAPDQAVLDPVGWQQLGHYGLAAWLTAALSTAAILLVQRWIESHEGVSALGRFTMAMTLVQVPLTPISYAAPLLLRRWMEQPGESAARRGSMLVFGVLMGAAALTGAASAVWPDLGLGVAYAGATLALAILLVGGAAEAASRLLTVQASASGLPWVAVWAEAARWAVLAIGWLWLSSPSLLLVCTVWAVGAWASALSFVWHARSVLAKAKP